MEENDKKKKSSKETIVPDGGWGWMVVLASFLIHFIMDGITYSMGQTFLEPMRTKLALDRASISTIFSILPAVTLGAGPIATVLTNMYGCRVVAMAGTCIAAFGFFLSRLWANVWYYYITIGIIGGLGFALMYLPAIVSVGFYFEKKRTFAMGIAVCGSGVGTSILPYIMNEIVNVKTWINYENALLIECCIIIISLLCGYLMRPLPQEPSEQRRLERKIRKEGQQKSTSEMDVKEVDIIEKSSNKSFFRQIIEQIDLSLLKNPVFTLFVISNFFTSLGFNVIYNFADDLANDANVAIHHRSYIVMSIGLSSIFGRIIIGFFGDQKYVNRLVLFIVALIISGVATMIAPLCGASVFQHIGYGSAFGFFSGGYVTLTAIVLVDIVGINKLSDAFGVFLLFVGIATAIGTPIVGGMRDAFANFARPFLWPYFIFGTCTVISGIVLFAIPLLQRKKLNDNQVEMDYDTTTTKGDLSYEEQQQNV
ncbi:unnamed protein product [Rotaria sordida]|uniref:Major facilitator superfamily (MFS) profile domain-containing protein n=2 Tax=Rotaria sordida TaxID=392033 RepID=A0A815Z5U2_9BILA|nr:unnamed protein product [Rotaria sordida]CAF1579132.1 unnamed protein product [Rotaria sordida]